MEREPGELARFVFREPAAGDPPADHPDDEKLAALLESRTPERADPKVVAHLASCDHCRREWIRMQRDARGLGEELAEPPWRIERAALGAGPGGAGAKPKWGEPAYRLLLSGAAVLVLVAVALLIPQPQWFTGETLRSEPGPESLLPLEPAGAIRAGEVPAFRWTAAPGATAYEIVVAESSTGRTVLRVRTTKTRYVLSDEDAALLVLGREYRWLIRAERGTGRTQTGRPASFSVLPAP